MEEDFAILQSG